MKEGTNSPRLIKLLTHRLCLCSFNDFLERFMIIDLIFTVLKSGRAIREFFVAKMLCR